MVQHLTAAPVWIVLLAGDFLKEHPLPQSSQNWSKVEEGGAEAKEAEDAAVAPSITNGRSCLISPGPEAL